jgi:hypothetical protein
MQLCDPEVAGVVAAPTLCVHDKGVQGRISRCGRLGSPNVGRRSELPPRNLGLSILQRIANTRVSEGLDHNLVCNGRRRILAASPCRTIAARVNPNRVSTLPASQILSPSSEREKEIRGDPSL